MNVKYLKINGFRVQPGRRSRLHAPGGEAERDELLREFVRRTLTRSPAFDFSVPIMEKAAGEGARRQNDRPRLPGFPEMIAKTRYHPVFHYEPLHQSLLEIEARLAFDRVFHIRAVALLVRLGAQGLYGGAFFVFSIRN